MHPFLWQKQKSTKEVDRPSKAGWYRCLLERRKSYSVKTWNDLNPRGFHSTVSVLLGVCHASGKPVRTPLKSCNPPPTPPSPLTWATDRASRLFKQQPGQGQFCEMVKARCHTCLDRTSPAWDSPGLLQPARQTLSRGGRDKAGGAWECGEQEKEGKSRGFVCCRVLLLHLFFTPHASSYSRWFMPQKDVEKSWSTFSWWLRAMHRLALLHVRRETSCTRRGW